jgi:hypothetical protein
MKTVLGVKNENELKKVQKILLNQMDRLDDEEIMKERGKREIMRSGAISQSAVAFVKSIQTQMKVLELSGKYNVEVDTMNDYLGIKKSDK